MSELQTILTTPYLHADMMNVPTAKLVNELLHRLKEEPKSYEICPGEFDDLRHEIFNVGY